jgi:hypothetical protein
VHSSGALRVVLREDCELYKSLDEFHQESAEISKFDSYVERSASPRVQGMGRRWSHIPWTEEMERSCRPWRVAVRLWNEALNVAGVDIKPETDASLDV